jgi:hypothetical protein
MNLLKIYLNLKHTTQYLLSFLGTIDFPFCYFTLYKGKIYKRLMYQQSFFDYLEIDDTNIISDTLVIYKRKESVKTDITDLIGWYPEFGQKFFTIETWETVFGSIDSIVTVDIRKNQIEYTDKSFRI